MPKQTLNALEMNTLPYETPLLLAAQHGHAHVSLLIVISRAKIQSAKILLVLPKYEMIFIALLKCEFL